MNCSKLYLDVPFVTIPSETLPPIPPPFLFKSQYEVNKPTWCQTPSFPLHFEEIGTNKYRDIGHEAYQLIGRNDRCHIILDDLMVSRCHALILHHSSGDSYLLDVGSSHGTYLGNIRLTPYIPTLIKKHSLMRFGSSDKQYMLREYPKVDDVLRKSNGCQSIEEKEVVLNTFHNITCLSTCTSAITRSLSLSKLFNRTPSDSTIHRTSSDSIEHPFDSRLTDSLTQISTSSDDLMSVCTSNESSGEHSSLQDFQLRYQLSNEEFDHTLTTPLISPASSLPNQFFASLSIPSSNQSQSSDISLDTDRTSISSSSCSINSNFSNDLLQQHLPELSLSQNPSTESSIEIRKCIRRSYSVDSTIRPTASPRFFSHHKLAAGLAGLPLNCGRRTCSVDLTNAPKYNQNGELLCGRKRVRFSISEFDLSKHQP